MTRSPALTSSASAGAARKHESTVAQAIARVMDMNAGLLICIWWSSSDRFRRAVCTDLRDTFTASSVHKVERGMQRTERADNGEDGKSQSDLDDTVARELAERCQARFIPW